MTTAARSEGEPDFQHLVPEVRPIAALDAEERAAHAKADRWISHRKAALVFSYLQETLEQPLRERMENLLVLAESGMGKTTLVRRFERLNAAPFEESVEVVRPVLVMRMPHKPDEKSFMSQLLGAISVPPTARGAFASPLVEAAARSRGAAFRVLEQIRTKVLIIDEINSVLVGTPTQQRLFLQFLRFLSNELSVALVCAGVPEARQALFSDAQLRSRFTPIELSMWQADAELQRFVNLFLASMPLRRPSPIDSPKVRQLLIRRTGGVTSSICKVLERAVVAAIRSGREYIDFEFLQDEAFWRGIAPPASPLVLSRRTASGTTT